MKAKLTKINDWTNSHRWLSYPMFFGIGGLIGSIIGFFTKETPCFCVWPFFLGSALLVIVPVCWGWWKKGIASLLIVTFLATGLHGQEPPPPAACNLPKPEGNWGAGAAALVAGGLFAWWAIDFCRRHFGQLPPPPPPRPPGTNAPPAAAAFRKGCPHGTCARLAEVEGYHGTYVALSVLGGRITSARVVRQGELISLSEALESLTADWGLDTYDQQSLEFRSTSSDINLDGNVWVFMNAPVTRTLERSSNLGIWEPVMSYRAPDDMPGVLNVSSEEETQFYRITQ